MEAGYWEKDSKRSMYFRKVQKRMRKVEVNLGQGLGVTCSHCHFDLFLVL